LLCATKDGEKRSFIGSVEQLVPEVDAISDGTYEKSTRAADDVDTERFESLVELDDRLSAGYDGAGGRVGLARS